MKKILILGLLLVSHLWGLKEWTYSCVSYNCREDDEAPKIPDDYKPQKGDRVIKVKVGNVEGEIVATEYGNSFIKSNQEKSYKYFGTLSEVFFIDYPNYTVAVSLSNGTGGSGVNFFQIFAIGNQLEMFQVLDDFILFCDYGKDSPCPLTKKDILDWIKKQGGQEFFDDACPIYYDTLNDVCSEGVIKSISRLNDETEE